MNPVCVAIGACLVEEDLCVDDARLCLQAVADVNACVETPADDEMCVPG